MASKLGGHSLIRDPTQESGGSFDPRTPEDRRHWFVVITEYICFEQLQNWGLGLL